MHQFYNQFQGVDMQHSSGAFPWKAFIFSCLVGYGLGVALRLVELPLWSAAHLHIDGEPLLGTHDAYAWAAGAEGTGRLVGRAMSDMLAVFSALFQVPAGTAAFWSPALLAPLVALPVCWMCVLWAMPEAGILASTFTSGALGFFLRTRLSFGDTDVLSLFFVLSALATVLWALTLFAPGGLSWRRLVAGSEQGAAPPELKAVAGRFLLAGLVVCAGEWFYPNARSIVLVLVVIPAVLHLLLGRKRNRSLLSFGYALLALVWLGGWPGVLAGGGIAFWVWKEDVPAERLTFRNLIVLWAGVLLLLAVNGVLLGLAKGLFHRLVYYSKARTSYLGDVVFPNRMLSVREAQDVDWTSLMARSGIHWSLFLAGVLGLLLLVLRHPLALACVPLLGLAVAGIVLGNRFTMFGGAPIGLGVGFLVSTLLRRVSRKQWFPWICHAGITVLVLLLLYPVAARMRPAPIMPKVYAQTLKDLAETAPEDARLWQWWDYGYAAQYFAGRETFDDGGSQKGLYPMALVHTTSSPQQAAQVMLMTTAGEQTQIAEGVANGTFVPDPDRPVQYYPTDPVLPLRELGDPAAAQAEVDSLAREEKAWPADLPPQYLVLSWENLRLGYWISYFGNWDLRTGKGVHGRVQRVSGKVRIDTKAGNLETARGTIPMRTLDIIDEKGLRKQAWSHAPGQHVVLNTLSREIYLMDDTVYDSMMVRMLLGDPGAFDEWFELVEDRFPWNRVYRVRQGKGESVTF
jgi:dolichyl-diphosphooligosaccharide--protein glycosyltransferase